MASRSWRGWGLRWDADPNALAKPQPVTIVGHDSSDGGGMRGVSSPTRNAGAGFWPMLTLTSALGFSLWTVDASPVGALTLLLSVVALDPGPGAATLDPIGFLYGTARDVSARTLVRPDAEQPPAPLAVPLASSAGIPSFVTFARPLIVPPGEHLLIWVAGGGGAVTLNALAVLFEEGL